ncbi:MAG: hypothetical protein GTO63_15055, partial [Anaerolineae bacterium]|nr:hypothetical protein [Anaerolineae bacterium]
ELRAALKGRGFALHLSTERKGDNLTAKLEVLDVKDERPLLKVVGCGRMEDIDLSLGFDVSEDALWDMVLRVLNALTPGETEGKR